MTLILLHGTNFAVDTELSLEALALVFDHDRFDAQDIAASHTIFGKALIHGLHVAIRFLQVHNQR